MVSNLNKKSVENLQYFVFSFQDKLWRDYGCFTYVHIFHILDWAHMLKDDIHKSATLILVGAYGIILLVVVSAHINL